MCTQRCCQANVFFHYPDVQESCADLHELGTRILLSEDYFLLHSLLYAAPSSQKQDDCKQGPLDPERSEVRRRSLLAYKYGATHKEIDEGKYPTNEQVVQALQQKVSKTVNIAQRYRRVLWYSLFVAGYLLVLYLQASAYKSADVVATLRNALMDDGKLSMTFNNEDEVLAYIGNKILLPTWHDPVCGDGMMLETAVVLETQLSRTIPNMLFMRIQSMDETYPQLVAYTQCRRYFVRYSRGGFAEQR